MEGEGRRGGMGWNVCRVIRGRGREGGREGTVCQVCRS